MSSCSPVRNLMLGERFSLSFHQRKRVWRCVCHTELAGIKSPAVQKARVAQLFGPLHATCPARTRLPRQTGSWRSKDVSIHPNGEGAKEKVSGKLRLVMEDASPFVFKDFTSSFLGFIEGNMAVGVRVLTWYVAAWRDSLFLCLRLGESVWLRLRCCDCRGRDVGCRGG